MKIFINPPPNNNINVDQIIGVLKQKVRFSSSAQFLVFFFFFSDGSLKQMMKILKAWRCRAIFFIIL